MAAGPLDRRITIQRNTPGATNGFNEAAESWADYVTVWAGRTDVRDSEKVAAGQVMGSLMCRFRIRSSSETRTVTTKDRLSYDSRTWQIHGVKESTEGRNRFIEITASAEID